MAVTIPIALISWIIIGALLLAVLRPPRALMANFAGAWMFLPEAVIPLPLLPDLSKVTAASYGALLGTLLFHSPTIFKWRPKLYDIPMFVWCGVGFFTSLANGLGAWDGFSAAFHCFLLWGLPYFLARIFVRNVDDVREVAMGMLIGGVIYAPLCLYEMRMWQSLHEIIYGFRNQPWLHTVRLSGYRPSVFMQHGLMVGLWMGNAALIALWLWWTRSLGRLWGIPAGLLAIGLTVVAVLCRSTGAIALVLMGLATLFMTGWLATRWAIAAILMIPLIYLPARATTLLSIDRILEVTVAQASNVVGEDRANSLAGRLHKELYYVDYSWKRPIFGWGGYNRMRPPQDQVEGKVRGVDSLWIMAFGMHGLVGLVSITTAILIPPALLLWRVRPTDLASPAMAPATALSVVLGVYMVDNLLNAMINPTYMIAAGGLVTLATAPIKMRKPSGSQLSSSALVRRAVLRHGLPNGDPTSLKP